MRRFESSEYLYFYLLTGSGLLFPVHALPEPDADSPPANPPWMAQTLRRFESSGNFRQPPWNSMFTSPPDYGEIFNYSQYRELAARLAAFPGRKNVICAGCLLSKPGAWEASSSDPSQAVVATKLRQLADVFRQAGVAVYSVGGLTGSRYLASQVNEDVDVTHVDQIDAFARATGGVAYAHGEIEQAITEAVDDGNSSYRVAYLPAAENWDGKPHRIRIVSTRRDVRVLAPSWYLADRLEDVEREWKQAIPDSLITSPLDRSDIAISVSPPQKIANTVHIEVRVNAADVLLLPRDGRYYGSLALQALCYTPDGRKQACAGPQQVKLDLSAQDRETVLRGGMWVPLTLTSREGFGRVRVVVYDPNSGAAGSSTFSVPETH
jgi:hypothetical protein